MNELTQLNEALSSKKKLEPILKNLQLNLDSLVLNSKKNWSYVPELYNVEDARLIETDLKKIKSSMEEFVRIFNSKSGYQEIDHTVKKYKKFLPTLNEWIQRISKNDVKWIYE